MGSDGQLRLQQAGSDSWRALLNSAPAVRRRPTCEVPPAVGQGLHCLVQAVASLPVCDSSVRLAAYMHSSRCPVLFCVSTLTQCLMLQFKPMKLTQDAGSLHGLSSTRERWRQASVSVKALCCLAPPCRCYSSSGALANIQRRAGS